MGNSENEMGKKLKRITGYGERLGLCLRYLSAACLMWVVGSVHSVVANTKTEARYALLIGNANYQVQTLKNPLNDVEQLSGVLQRVGFHVFVVKDADLPTMESEVNRFSEQLRKNAKQNTIALIYYSGHGAQVDGSNYLIPLNAMSQVTAAHQLKYKTMALGFLMDSIPKVQLKIILLDACRDNPFPVLNQKGYGQKGLAIIKKSSNSLVAYAAAPGKIAADGGGDLSPYAKHLALNIPREDIPIETMLRYVRSGVSQETRGFQQPEYVMSSDQAFYFNLQGGVNIDSKPTQYCEQWVDTAKTSRKTWVETSPWSSFREDKTKFCVQARKQRQALYPERQIEFIESITEEREIFRAFIETEYQVACHFKETWTETVKSKQRIPCSLQD